MKFHTPFFAHTTGFVIIDNVISKEECENTIDEIWCSLEKEQLMFAKTKVNFHTLGLFPYNQVDRNDSTNWDKPTFPENRLGIVGAGPTFDGIQIWKNRVNPNLCVDFLFDC